jgi:hypothetical protein
MDIAKMYITGRESATIVSAATAAQHWTSRTEDYATFDPHN